MLTLLFAEFDIDIEKHLTWTLLKEEGKDPGA
jgi:hypothetical protein